MASIEISYPYSQVRRAAGLIFLSGEVAFDADGKVPPGITAQTRLTLERIENTLKNEGLTLDHIVSITVHLMNPSDFGPFNDEYRQILRAPYPVRTTVSASLVDDVLVEISAIAAEKI